MLHKTKIGVCMDYSVAYLLEEKNEEKIITIIESDDEIIEATPGNADMTKTERKRRKNHAFYKKVFEIVKDFDKVSLFGPEAVKNELLNRIKANRMLEIEIFNNSFLDKITENQKINFINEYFGS